MANPRLRNLESGSARRSSASGRLRLLWELGIGCRNLACERKTAGNDSRWVKSPPARRGELYALVSTEADIAVAHPCVSSFDWSTTAPDATAANVEPFVSVASEDDSLVNANWLVSLGDGYELPSASPVSLAVALHRLAGGPLASWSASGGTAACTLDPVPWPWAGTYELGVSYRVTGHEHMSHDDQARWVSPAASPCRFLPRQSTSGPPWVSATCTVCGPRPRRRTSTTIWRLSALHRRTRGPSMRRCRPAGAGTAVWSPGARTTTS